jgi:hypothetical protein
MPAIAIKPEAQPISNGEQVHRIAGLALKRKNPQPISAAIGSGT